LQQAGHEVTPCNILLGVSGTIFKDSYKLLHTSLVLTKEQAKETCNQLNLLHAVTSLSSIYQTKLHPEQSPDR
jgi:hypothetical protein